MQLARRTISPAHGHFVISSPDQHKLRSLNELHGAESLHVVEIRIGLTKMSNSSYNFHHCVLKDPVTGSVLRKINPFHNLVPYCSQIHIIISSIEVTSSNPDFLIKFCTHFLSLLLPFITRIFGDEYELRVSCSLLCNFLYPRVTFSSVLDSVPLSKWKAKLKRIQKKIFV